jgi:hypothetical protein
MTVKSSRDEGKTWSGGVSVWKGPSGYSQLVPLKTVGEKAGEKAERRAGEVSERDGEAVQGGVPGASGASGSVKLGLLFEAGVDYTYSTISFVVVDV